mgnify:CR=1 FL=1
MKGRDLKSLSELRIRTQHNSMAKNVVWRFNWLNVSVIMPRCAIFYLDLNNKELKILSSRLLNYILNTMKTTDICIIHQITMVYRQPYYRAYHYAATLCSIEWSVFQFKYSSRVLD